MHELKTQMLEDLVLEYHEKYMHAVRELAETSCLVQELYTRLSNKEEELQNCKYSLEELKDQRRAIDRKVKCLSLHTSNVLGGF